MALKFWDKREQENEVEPETLKEHELPVWLLQLLLLFQEDL
jgi:hypothetical protein